MKRKAGWLVAAMLVGSVWTAPAMAADHLDSPGVVADPAADINDVYAFRSKDPDATNVKRTVFVMTVVPAADVDSRFSPNVQYQFWIRDGGEGQARKDIICTAAGVGDSQTMTCTAPNGSSKTVDFNGIDRGDATNDDIRVFAGLRDDPFFFDLDAFFAVVGDPNMVGILLDDEGTDFFAPLGTLTIVVDVLNTVFDTSTTLQVYGRTNRMGLDRSTTGGE